MTATAWDLPDHLDAGGIALRLAEALGATCTAPEDVVVRYLDTFDGRLHAAGIGLRVEESDGTLTLHHGQVDHQDRGQLPLAAVPRWPRDVPGRLGARLSEICEMRALLVRVEVAARRWPVEVRDARDKLVLRVIVEERSVVDGGRRVPLGRAVRLAPLRGYDTPLRQARKAIKRLGLEQPAPPPYEAAMAAVGRPPGEQVRAPAVPLDPTQRADAATRRVLWAAWRVLRVNESGARDDLDSEFLHDVRIAVRQTRSVLSQIKDVFPPTQVARFSEGFKWVGAVTGPTRDLDVFLLDFPSFVALVPEEQRAHLAPLRAHLEAAQRRAQGRVVAMLDGKRWHELASAWEAFLATEPPKKSVAGKAERPIAAVVSKRIAKVYARVLAEGRAIGSDSPAEALHDLRKTGKKLRYLLELFEHLLADRPVSRCISDLKRLLKNLGAFQDHEVQADAMAQFGRELLETGAGGADTLLTMGVMVEALHQRRAAARANFATTFGAFDRPAVHRRFAALAEVAP